MQMDRTGQFQKKSKGELDKQVTLTAQRNYYQDIQEPFPGQVFIKKYTCFQ